MSWVRHLPPDPNQHRCVLPEIGPEDGLGSVWMCDDCGIKYRVLERSWETRPGFVRVFNQPDHRYRNQILTPKEARKMFGDGLDGVNHGQR